MAYCNKRKSPNAFSPLPSKDSCTGLLGLRNLLFGWLKIDTNVCRLHPPSPGDPVPSPLAHIMNVENVKWPNL